MIRFLALCAVLSLTLAGQNSPSLTIDQVVVGAIDKNLDLIATKYGVSIAEARRITARLRPNPVVTISADHLDILGTHYDEFNSAGPNEFAYRTDFLLERGGKRAARMELAAAELSVAELGVREAVRQVSLQAQTAFVELQLAQEALQLAQENLKVMNGIVEVNTARVRSGDLAGVELNRSQVAALQFANEVRQAELRVQQARNQLQLLLGDAPGGDLEITGALRREALTMTLDEFQQNAAERRPDLLLLRKSETRSASDLRLQIAEGKVDWVAGTEYRRQQGLNGTGNSLGFFFSAPLPVSNRNQGEIARARVEIQQAQARIKAQEARVRIEVDSAWREYQVAQSLLAAIEGQMLEKARDVRNTTEYSYRRGEASFVEFLDAQRAFNDTVQGYNEARAGFARSLYVLDSVSARAVQP